MKIEFPFSGSALPDKYGVNAAAIQKYHDKNLISFPFKVTNIPQGATSIAFSLIDHDTVPIIGFSWIHWLAANIQITAQSAVEIEENASQRQLFLQGTNSYISSLEPYDEKENVTQRYVGPRPRGGVHDYTLTVYALDAVLNLKAGFYYPDLLREIEKHFLCKSYVKLKYEKRK
ncbi:YbhB/YbcL family Raf kinase inhibitor-like protein [Clostridium sp. Mt-5]|uniref:YbhB/YbcL family Raf kinase inhibitor-like protein n=1 Tax=Clostridium moutaii TaxID=3240932 RepID=A0ABV4BT80_9CLOT